MDNSTAPSTASHQEWFLFSCQGCGRPVKVRVSQAGARLKCPSCDSELTLPNAIPINFPTGPRAHDDQSQPPAVRPAMPGSPYESPRPRTLPGASLISQANPDVKSTPGGEAPRIQLAVDRLDKAQFRQIDDPAFAIPDKGLRVRKRKRRSHQPHKDPKSPQWDDAAEAIVTEEPAPEVGDGWRELTTATVSVETREDGSVVERRKRFKKKRLPSGVEKTFLGLGHAARFGLIALGALIIVGAILGGFYLAQSRDEAPAEPAWTPEIQDRRFATIDESHEAEATVRAFFSATSLEGKLEHVRFPDKVRPLMQQWSQSHDASVVEDVRTYALEPLVKLVNVGDLRFVVIALDLLPSQEVRFFAVERTSAGGRLDWETAVGYQPMPLEEFKLQRPLGPVPFRVAARAGDYYNGQFVDQERWLACDLTYPGDPNFHLFGYVDVATPAGRRLSDRLATQSVSMILGLAYPSKSADPNQVVITDIISEQWFLASGPLTREMAR
jgi:hypothetical protein